MEPAALETLYRRSLPEDLVAFASPRGRQLFRAALEHGTMEGWFALAEQFHTQAEPAFCGLGSLVVALNALGVDPKRPWKGPWRWYSEELLDCCVPLPEVRERGLTLDELGCLARCNGLDAEVKHADRAGPDELQADALAAARGDGSVVIASYSRPQLGQTGAGHFSPIGGVDAAEHSALLLDVARFKYPPYWVALARLYGAMTEADAVTGRARGWIVVRRRGDGAGQLASLVCAHAGWREVAAAFAAPLARWRATPPADLPAALRSLVELLPPLTAFFGWRVPSDEAHRLEVEGLRRALRDSPAGLALAPYSSEVELAALAVLVLGPGLVAELGTATEAARSLAAALAALVEGSGLAAGLAAEVALLRRQLQSLTQAACAAGGCAPR